jgi:hypothetical protein
MKTKLKLWLRRLALRQLRKLADLADDRLHAAEVKLRADLCADKPCRESVAPDSAKPVRSRTCLTRTPGPAQSETFLQWEARRSGVAVVSKKEARRRRGLTARAFDLRFAR